MSEVKQVKVLETLESAANYRRWLIKLAAENLRGEVFELGSGLGRYAEQILLEDSHDEISLFHLTEVSQESLRFLSKRFQGSKKVKIHDLSKSNPTDINADNFVSWNVLEHIENDVEALKMANRVCLPGSSVFVLVPAMQFAFSKFDLELKHFRRYSKRELTDKARFAGLTNIEVSYVNSIGILLWFVLVKLLNIKPKDNLLLRAYDKFLLPLQIRLESKFSLPFGQSLVLKAKTTELSRD